MIRSLALVVGAVLLGGCGFGGGGASSAPIAGSTSAGSTASTPPGASLRVMVVETDGLTVTAPGAGQQLRACGAFSDGRCRDITRLAVWTVSDPTVATIDSFAFLWPRAAGTVTVQASYAGIAATGQIRVAGAPATPGGLASVLAGLPAPDALIVSPPSRNLVDAGAKQQLNVWGWWTASAALCDVTRTVQFSVSDPSIAAVDSLGVLTAVGNGTVTVTVVWQGFTDSVQFQLGPGASLPNGDGPFVVGNAWVAAAVARSAPPPVPAPVPVPAPPPSYQTDILPVLQTKCTGCHGTRQPALVPYSAALQFVSAGNPSASLLIQKTQNGGSMAKFCSSQDQTLILAWVQQGAAP